MRPMPLYKPGQVRKAVGVAIAGTYAWGQLVVASAPSSITASEWLVLAGVGVATAAAFGLTNDPVPEPEREPEPLVLEVPLPDLERPAAP